MKTTLLLASLLASIVVAEKYAMVFGTADEWGNYSITSEPCRVYDSLLLHGFKPDNILFMTYTSVVTAEENPFKGMIFTNPSETTDGDWAKYGCFEHVDYTDEDINPEVFLAILSGDGDAVKELTGKENPKVMSYTPEDTLFTYFMDHGLSEYIYVGSGVVSAMDLRAAMQTAYEKQLYGKWVWFMEACYSGSMFMEFPADWNIFVFTSADDANSASMSNCPPDDVVAGRELNTCLSGLWDNIWLDFAAENPDASVGTLADVVHARVAEESGQNPSQFGDLSFRDLPLADFFGKPAQLTRDTLSSSLSSVLENTRKARRGTVPLDEVSLHLAKWRAIRATTSKSQIEALATLREEVSAKVRREVEMMRLGRTLLSEQDTERAAQQESNQKWDSGCVATLQMEWRRNCNHSAVPGKEAMRILRSICKTGSRVPKVNWSTVCIA